MRGANEQPSVRMSKSQMEKREGKGWVGLAGCLLPTRKERKQSCHHSRWPRRCCIKQEARHVRVHCKQPDLVVCVHTCTRAGACTHRNREERPLFRPTLLAKIGQKQNRQRGIFTKDTNETRREISFLILRACDAGQRTQDDEPTNRGGRPDPHICPMTVLFWRIPKFVGKLSHSSFSRNYSDEDEEAWKEDRLKHEENDHVDR